MSLLKDFSVPAVVAGFVTLPVGCSRSAVIVFQAVQSLGAAAAKAAA